MDNMDFGQIMKIIEEFLEAIKKVLQLLGLDKLFKKEEKKSDTNAAAATPTNG